MKENSHQLINAPMLCHPQPVFHQSNTACKLTGLFVKNFILTIQKIIFGQNKPLQWEIFTNSRYGVDADCAEPVLVSMMLSRVRA